MATPVTNAGGDLDAAIDDPRRDELGRKGFAQALARSINQHKAGECRVTALCGPWGDGKTSVANMALSYLARIQRDGLTIVHFAPWQIADHEKLTAEFFRTLAPAFKTKDAEETKKRGVLWQSLGILATTTKHISRWILLEKAKKNFDV